MSAPSPVRAVVRWYLRHYFRTPDDLSGPATFCQPRRVGPLAITEEELRRGDGAALFRLFLACAMFQAQRDTQVFRILTSLSTEAGAELGSSVRLQQLAAANPCPNQRTTELLHECCDLTKTPRTKRGTCSIHPKLGCALKQHTEWLRRYGDFGKLPTSAALVLQEAGVTDLAELYHSTVTKYRRRGERAAALAQTLQRVWRISEKVANLFLHLAANPDVTSGAPWASGLAWTEFVVVDRHVEAFLVSLGAPARASYDERRQQLQHLAERIDLRELDRRLHRYNPQLLAAAMYTFLSASNRRASARDCSRLGAAACARCPKALRSRCPVRVSSRSVSNE